MENLGYTTTSIPNYIEMNVRGLPRPRTRTNGLNTILNITGANIFCLSTLFILITTLYFIVVEKENKIRIGMMTMGLRNMSYWTSWFLFCLSKYIFLNN
jgi:hypothetical protein